MFDKKFSFVKFFPLHLILVVLFYLSMIIFSSFNEEDIRHPFFRSFASILIPLFILSLGRFLSVIIIPLLMSFLLFLSYLVFNYGYISTTMIEAIIGSSYQEDISILSSLNIYLVLLIFLFICFFLYLSYKAARFNKKCAIFFGILLSYNLIHSYNKVYSPDHKDIRIVSIHGYFFRRHLLPPLGDIVYIIFMLRDGENQQAIPHQKVDSIVRNKGIPHRKNIIIVIGESDQVNRHTYYGYKAQNTTPRIQKLVDEGRVCLIRNAHSSANMTRYAVPMILSFYEPDYQDKLYSEKNLIELAKDNGYYTFWIGSQEGVGPYARPYGYISEFSDYVVRPDYEKYDHVDWHDESLLPILKKKFLNNSENKLFIIHLVGSHASTRDKRTEEDIKALPNAIPYDQSIHRTDRILSEIVKLADQDLKNYVLFYTSDHGELVDNNPELAGHGLQYGGYEQYHIPVFIIDSDKRYCDMAERMRNKDGYYTEIMDKYLFLDMMGYDTFPEVWDRIHNVDNVLHSDSKIYMYRNIPEKSESWLKKNAL